MINTLEVLELRHYLPILEEVGSKPYLLHVRLVGVVGEDLLYGELLLCLPVLSQPHQGETSSIYIDYD